MTTDDNQDSENEESDSPAVEIVEQKQNERRRAPTKKEVIEGFGQRLQQMAIQNMILSGKVEQLAKQDFAMNIMLEVLVEQYLDIDPEEFLGTVKSYLEELDEKLEEGEQPDAPLDIGTVVPDDGDDDNDNDDNDEEEEEEENDKNGN